MKVLILTARIQPKNTENMFEQVLIIAQDYEQATLFS